MDRRASAPDEVREERRRRRLAGRPGNPDRRHGGTLEDEVAEAADDTTALAQQPHARGDLRRPDVEERLLVATRVRVEVGVRANLDLVGAHHERLLRGGPGTGERDPATLAREEPGERNGV